MNDLLSFRIVFSDHFLRLKKILRINVTYFFPIWALQKATTSFYLSWNNTFFLEKALSSVSSTHRGIFCYGFETDAIFMYFKATLYQFIAPQMSALILMEAKHIANMCPLMSWNRVIIPFYSHCTDGTVLCEGP